MARTKKKKSPEEIYRERSKKKNELLELIKINQDLYSKNKDRSESLDIRKRKEIDKNETWFIDSLFKGMPIDSNWNNKAPYFLINGKSYQIVRISTSSDEVDIKLDSSYITDYDIIIEMTNYAKIVSERCKELAPIYIEKQKNIISRYNTLLEKIEYVKYKILFEQYRKELELLKLDENFEVGHTFIFDDFAKIDVNSKETWKIHRYRRRSRYRSSTEMISIKKIQIVSTTDSTVDFNYWKNNVTDPLTVRKKKTFLREILNNFSHKMDENTARKIKLERTLYSEIKN